MGNAGVHLEVGGKRIASFESVSGLSEDHKVLTLKGSGGGDVRSSVRQWAEAAEAKSPDGRRDGAVVTLDAQGDELARWNFVNGWPKSWSASDLEAGTVDEVQITHEGITKA